MPYGLKYRRDTGPVTLTVNSRTSFYGDKTTRKLSFKDEYEAKTYLSSFSCRDARWRPEVLGMSRDRFRGC